MNAKAFLAAKEQYDRGCPFSDPGKAQKIWDKLAAAAAPEHAGENVGEHMSDKIKCSCGWESRGYWDGAVFAWEAWREHVAGHCAPTPQKKTHSR